MNPYHNPTGAGSSSSAHHEWRIDIPGDVAPEIDRLLCELQSDTLEIAAGIIARRKAAKGG